MGNGTNMWFGGGFMWVFWVLLIVIVIWLINSINNRRTTEDKPLDILKKRYARGEIDDKEFETRRKELDE